MSYLHPAYFRLLPPALRPQLVAFLQIVERNAFKSADGWADIRQSMIALELGRTVRTVKRWELLCVRSGILLVEHGGRRNRRRLALRSAKEALESNPAPRSGATEWGHGRHHSGDTHVPTVDNSLHIPRARSSERRPLSTQTRKPAPPADAATPSRTGPGPGPVTMARTLEVANSIGSGWTRKLAGLVLELHDLQGDRLTAGFLEVVSKRTAGIVDGYARSRAVFGLLESRLRKLREGRRHSRG